MKINTYHKNPSAFFPLRTILYAWALTGLLVLSGCIIADIDGDDDFGRTDFVAHASFSFKVDITSQTRIRLEAINGNVKISGRADAASVTVSGERQVGSHSQSDAERHLDNLQVEVEDRGDEIVIRTIQPKNNQGRNYVVDYTITLPVDLEVAAGLVNGNLTVETIDNVVSVHTVNGNVDLREITGSASVELINGNIDSEVFLPLEGTIVLATTNGNIALGIPLSTSAALTARVTNGAINLSNLNLQNPDLTNLSLTGTLGDGDGSIELRTVNGNIGVNGF